MPIRTDTSKRNKLTGYELHRNFFDFAAPRYECRYVHIALYTYIVDKCNRLHWEETFGLPTNFTMGSLSIGNRRTYQNALRDLAEWGFIDIVQKSKNQNKACKIRLCLFKNAQLDEKVPVQKCSNTTSSKRTRTAPVIKHKTKTVNNNKLIKGDFEFSEIELKIRDRLLPLYGLPKNTPHTTQKINYMIKWFKTCRDNKTTDELLPAISNRVLCIRAQKTTLPRSVEEFIKTLKNENWFALLNREQDF